MKKLLLLLTVAIAALSMSAAPVDQATALKKARNFLVKDNYAGKVMSPSLFNPTLAQAQKSRVQGAGAVFYIYTTDNAYVIVSGDDRAEEVLAYGDYKLDLKNLPAGFKDMLNQYQDAIEFLQQNPTLKVSAIPSPQNSPLLKATSVDPLLSCNWDQEAPYYNECSFGGYQCLTGCPATSAAMVFYYWKYPTDPVPALPGYSSTIEYSYWGSMDYNHSALPSVTFDWDNMRDSYSGSYTQAQGAAVAQLMHYVGHAERMIYGVNGSGISVDSVQNIVDAFILFGYDPESTRMLKKVESMDDYGNEGAQIYTDAQWAAILQEEMLAERPVVFCAVSTSGGGHAFNVDGYNSASNKYHVNFGWSGSGNDWFALNAFSGSGYTFNVYQQMVIGIQPPATGPGIKATPSKLGLEALVDHSVSKTFTVKGNEITGDITLTLNDASGYFSIDATSVAASDYAEGKTITVTYAPLTSGTHDATITLSNAGAEDVVVTLTGVATLETSVPVMLPADSAFVNLTQFRADWTDQTADKNVDSYTLLVGTKPSTALLEVADFSDYPTQNGNQASRADELIPEGWTFVGDGLWLDGASIEPSRGSTLTTPQYDLTGYDKVTVVVTFKSWSSYTAGTLDIATSKASQTLTGPSTFTTFTVVLDCADTENIVFTAGYYPMIQKIEIYAGELEQATLRAIVEEGDATQRLVTGITDKNYTVKDLEAGGTFYYKVKAVYIDGTESIWSNTQVITLFENGPEPHGFDLGDVNHDGEVTIKDVTMLIDYLLSGEGEICPICADVSLDSEITIKDVTMLIDMLLGN